ncbi:MAG: metalloregulator ArsR/SmtB family transcription factor [Candidatus Omnitrophota bacterium]
MKNSEKNQRAPHQTVKGKAAPMNDELLTLIGSRLKAMSEPTRLKILQMLKEGELSVGEIAEKAGLKHGTASANLNALQKAGLVTCRREGTKILYRIGSDMVFRICDVVCAALKEEWEDMEKWRKSLA